VRKIIHITLANSEVQSFPITTAGPQITEGPGPEWFKITDENNDVHLLNPDFVVSMTIEMPPEPK
jgi:hypothetical protein